MQKILTIFVLLLLMLTVAGCDYGRSARRWQAPQAQSHNADGQSVPSIS